MQFQDVSKIYGPNGLWIISRGRYTDLDMSRVNGGMKAGPIMEYRISDLAKYLLSPNPIEVPKRLVGCEIHYHQRVANGITGMFRRLFPRPTDRGVQKETLIFNPKNTTIPLKDKNLVAHMEAIYRLLKPYNPTFKKLLSLERETVSDIIGICEDIDGNRTWLSLKGGINEKIHYLSSFIMEDVGVILEKAFVAEGFFEMRGFDFTTYDANKGSKLLKFHENGVPKACVLHPGGSVEYWVDDINLIHFLQLLDQSIRTNPKFYESFKLCHKGKATPLRLLFNRSIAIDYSKARLPEAYRDVFDTYHIGMDERDVVINTLKNRQLGIMFQYIPKSPSGEEKLFTNISVLHDIRALDAIKNDLPLLYSVINQKATISEAGRYYLLDSIRGCTNEN
ncbi:MAG: hypothetical protein JW932_02020 [Deltaproteobacteria bacterium]|nr:hypothetical protein [Deltaproteobacteria bacterium]